ncbi:hypothetical protein ACFQ7G_19820 [Streptomyces massasporeus]
MTALLDTRRAVEEQVTALGERLEASRREITDTVTTQVSDLRTDNRETRSRINSTSTSLSEVTKTLPALRQEVADLSRTVETLRSAVNDLFTRMPQAAGATPSNADDPAPETAHEHSGQWGLNDADRGPAPQADPATQRDIEGTSRMAPPSAAGIEAGTELAEEAASRRASTPAEAEKQSTVKDGSTDVAGSPDAASLSSRKEVDLSGERARHDNVLASAATVGTVHLVCHRDLWGFIQEHAAEVPHFRAPAEPCEEGHDRLRIALSGRSVIGTLIAMRAVQTANAKYGSDDGTWALSGAVYQRLAHDLTTTGRSGARPLTVVFDDGIDETPDPQ